MKNVLIVDGADNCAYDIFAASAEDFALFFPVPGQDIAFIDEILATAPEAVVEPAFARLWAQPAHKSEVDGVHGTIFYDCDHKKPFYPNRRDADLTENGGRPRYRKE